MKPSDFAQALHAAAAFSGSAALAQLASAFAESKTATIAAHLKACEASVGGDTIASDDAVNDLGKLKEFLAACGASAFTKDVVAVFDVALKSGSKSVEELAGKLERIKVKKSSQVVAQVDHAASALYARKLEETLGDDPGFKALVAELSANKAMGKAELLLVVKEFVGAAAKSRADALKKISARHEALMAQRAKSESRDGRSAA